MKPLAESLAASTGDTVYVIDWGIFEPVNFCSKASRICANLTGS